MIGLPGGPEQECRYGHKLVVRLDNGCCSKRLEDLLGGVCDDRPRTSTSCAGARYALSRNAGGLDCDNL